MKELIVFSLVMIFIACQNQPHSKSALSEEKTAPKLSQAALLEDSLNCMNEVEEIAMDIAKELEHPIKPGIYYREATLRSEATTDSLRAELACLSEVTSSDESESLQTSLTPTSDAEPEATLDTWQTLTQKWEVVPQKLACEDPNSSLENPSCKESVFLTEEGKFFSAGLDETMALNQL